MAIMTDAKELTMLSNIRCVLEVFGGMSSFLRHASSIAGLKTEDFFADQIRMALLNKGYEAPADLVMQIALVAAERYSKKQF